MMPSSSSIATAKTAVDDNVSGGGVSEDRDRGGAALARFVAEKRDQLEVVTKEKASGCGMGGGRFGAALNRAHLKAGLL